MVSNEGFYMEDGKMQDAALFDDIFKVTEGDRALSKMAIARAIERGMTAEEAERAYGIPEDK